MMHGTMKIKFSTYYHDTCKIDVITNTTGSRAIMNGRLGREIVCSSVGDGVYDMWLVHRHKIVDSGCCGLDVANTVL